MTDKNMEKFIKFIDRLKGRKDVKSRVAVLASPDNWKSMSVLTHGQVEFVADAFYLSGVDAWGGLFDGLRELADEIMETSPSVGGIGREQSIRLVGALSESKILSKMGITMSGEPKGGKS